MRVLHVSARLSEGGAAAVARTIADTLAPSGVESEFLYGYGKRGAASPMESSYDTVRLGTKATAAAQIALHQVRGMEGRFARRGALEAATEAIHRADIVHVHVPHSYFLDFGWFVDTLTSTQKPWAWTLHDQWAFTGRCAQPGDCVRWKTGCGSCPTMHAYPPGLIDLSARNHEKRRQLLTRMGRNLPHQWVACAGWLADEFLATELGQAQTITNSVDPQFWSVLQDSLADRGTKDPQSVLFIVRDLRDSAKIDWQLLHMVASDSRFRLTIAGDNSPQEVSGARHIPAVTDRRRLFELLSEHNTLLFTSTVDYYPLTVVEALAAGMNIVAAKSNASTEFQGKPGVHLYSTRSAAVSALASNLIRVQSPTRAGNAEFSPDRMAGEYLSVYERLSAA